MSSDLRDLYQEVLLDHSKRPRNLRAIADADAQAKGYNALCGDRVTIYVKRAGERLEAVAFEGAGCAICTASASVMTEILTGKTGPEAEALYERFHLLVTGRSQAGEDASDLGKLAIFAGVSEFPVRVKCATLPWHTFHAALAGEAKEVSTE